MKRLFSITTQSLLLFFLLISLLYAECGSLSPSRVITSNRAFSLNYFVFFRIEDREIKIKGYLTQSDANNNNKPGGFIIERKKPGEFIIDSSNISYINLVGTEGPEKKGIKKFILHSGDAKIHFISNDRTIDKYVDGGYFDKSLWTTCPYYPDGKTKCGIYYHVNIFECIKEKGGIFCYPQLPCYSTPYISTKTTVTSDGTPKTVILAPEAKLSDLTSKKENTLASLKKKLEKRTTTLSIDTSLRKLVPKRKKTITSYKEDIKICDVKGKRLPSKDIKLVSNTPVFTGFIKNKKKTQAFWFDPELATAPNPERFTIDLSSLKNKYIPIELSSHLKNTDKNNIIPIKFESLHYLPRTSLSLEKKSKINKITIIIIGDTNSISFSGIDKAEKILLKRIKNKINWDIHWFDVNSKGGLLPRKNFSSFEQLIQSVRKIKKEKILLSRELQFTTFLKNFEKKILQYKNTIDYVIWVKDSYSLPLKSPDLFYSTLEKIQKRGKLSRFKNGKPYQWLYLLSGNMPGGNRSLLEEPMARLDPIPGQIEEEKKMLEPRRLLQKPDRLATALGAVVIRHQKQLPAELRISSNNLYINAKEALAKIGLLIPLKKLKKLLKINKSILDKIREKNYTKASKNKCTHIFFSEDDMGLKWLK